MPLRSVDLRTKEPQKASVERSDTCVVPAAGVVAEAMLALVLADALLEKTGGDSLAELLAHLEATRERPAAARGPGEPGRNPAIIAAPMPIRPIVKYGDAVLHAPARPVERIDDGIRALFDDMVQTMYAAPGIGLAAPQIGVPLRVIVIDLSVGEDPKQLIRLVNPEIVEREGEQKHEEGCLSIPGYAGSPRAPGPGRRARARPRGQRARVRGDRAARARLLPRDRPHRRPAVRGPAVAAQARPDEAQAAQAACGRGGRSSAVRVVFLASGAFAIPSLEALVGAGHEVAAARHPARPRERPGPGARAAEGQARGRAPRHRRCCSSRACARPRRRRRCASCAPELQVVVAFGQILPRAVIDIAPRGTVNVHASLLPRLRGAAPIQWAIANGDTETGVTTMQIDEGLDTGPLLLARALPIGPDETAAELEPRLARLGGELLVETLAGLAHGHAPARRRRTRAAPPTRRCSRRRTAASTGAPGAARSPAARAASTPGRAPSRTTRGACSSCCASARPRSGAAAREPGR